jgi:polysaccharide biosynthesis transport protein
LNIVFFIRLLLRHIWLILAMPVMLFTIVFFMTREQPEKYVSETTIYTGIASGSSIVSLEENRTDFFSTRTAFDNLISIIKSKTTAEEVGIRLFTSHMLIDKPEPSVISKESYAELMKTVPDEIKALVVKNNFEKTYRNFLSYKKQDYKNFIYKLVHLDHPHYSASKILSQMRVSRVQSSDMIEIAYHSDDPGICYNTLLLLNEVFVKSYAKLKINQSDAVVNYFQNELNKSQDKLNDAEKELLDFNRNNNIINYYEQTKHISSEKQIFENDLLKIKMQNAAAESVLKVLEKKLNTNQKKKLNSKEIIDLRRQLADINLDIATKAQLSELGSVDEDMLIKEIAELKIKSFNIQEQLKKKVEHKYDLDNSTEGLATGAVLDDWLKKVIEYESTKAHLDVAAEKEIELEQLYTDYAPLGANMKRLERKIDVAEQEYLSILHSLNLAKLKQQNIELNTNLKVSEPPFFPIQSEPGKRKYLLIIALMAGFLIPASVIIALEFLDSNIKNARRAENFSRLKVASIYPHFVRKNKKTDMNLIEDKALEMIIRRIILNKGNSRKEKSPEPARIAFLSSYQGEGKTTLLKKVLTKMTIYGYKCCVFTTGEMEPAEKVDVIKYIPGNEFVRVQNIQELTSKENDRKLEDYDFIFIEIPGLIYYTCPVGLLKKINSTYLVTRANRPWNKADDNIIDDLRNIQDFPEPQIILNGVEVTEMETVIGDLPMKRSFIRKIMKKLFSLQFFSRKSFRKA